MPFSNNQFDYILANQSLEHWFEYGVSINDGLSEIARVLKKDAEAWINFPLFLHGDPRCVKGDFASLLREIPQEFFSSIKVEFLKSDSNGNYKGWRYCGFPDFLIDSDSSINVNLILKRNATTVIKSGERRPAKRITRLDRITRYGLAYFLWKIIFWSMGLDRVRHGDKS